jgi:hypothetical protein
MKTRQDTRDEMKRREGMTSREIVVCAACALATSFAAGVVFADDHDDAATVPAGVGFSGWLSDADGAPIDGEVDLEVGVFAGASGGDAIEEFRFTGVEVDGGRFSITLESQTGELWDGSTRWLEVTVGDDVLSPRTAIVSTPYALRAGVAASLTESAKADVVGDLEARVAALEAKLASVRVEGTDVYFEGVNVHVRDGSGSTLPVAALPPNGNVVQVPSNGSGLGNLIIGYNEPIGPDARDGQHNLVVGVGHSYATYASIVGGYNNTVQSHSSAALGGWLNETDDAGAVAVGGARNRATANGAVAVGGEGNESDSQQTVSVGGEGNFVNANNAVVVGGLDNAIERDGERGDAAVIVGGEENEIAGRNDSEAPYSVIVGGSRNTIDGPAAGDDARRSVIVGGDGGSVSADDAVVVGGQRGSVSADRAVQVAGVDAENATSDTGEVATP